MTMTYTISAADAAFLLRRELGPRNWYEFLHDARRRDASIEGLTLLPCCRLHDGTALRPRYDAHAVKAFVEAVKAIRPTAGRTPIETVIIDLDDGPLPAWQMRRYDRDGNPIVSKAKSVVTFEAA